MVKSRRLGQNRLVDHDKGLFHPLKGGLSAKARFSHGSLAETASFPYEKSRLVPSRLAEASPGPHAQRAKIDTGENSHGGVSRAPSREDTVKRDTLALYCDKVAAKKTFQRMPCG